MSSMYTLFLLFWFLIRVFCFWVCLGFFCPWLCGSGIQVGHSEVALLPCVLPGAIHLVVFGWWLAWCLSHVSLKSLSLFRLVPFLPVSGLPVASSPCGAQGVRLGPFPGETMESPRKKCLWCMASRALAGNVHLWPFLPLIPPASQALFLLFNFNRW